MSVTLAPKDRRNESPAPSSAMKPGAKGLRIGAAGDAFEREADRVADRVMSGGDMLEWSFAKTGAGEIQRQPTPDPSNQAGVTDQQTAPQPNNYKDAAGKLGEAFLQTDVGKKLKDAASNDPLVKGAEDFVGTLPGKIITGAAAAAAVSTLAATHKALPAQIPEIPLDVVHPGLKVKVTYEGAVDHPTKAMITFSFTPGGDKKKKEPTASQRYLAETAPVAASMDEIRAGMHYAPGSPQAQQEAADKKMFDDAMARRFGSLPGTGGVPLIPPKGAGQAGATQAGAGGSGWTFSPLAHPELDKKLDLQPLATGSGATLQRKCACQEGSGGECEECKKKSETVQRKAAGPTEDVAPPIVDQVLSSSGRPLDKATRDYFEPRFGYDFSKVRIHSDAQAAESARAVNALAYTVGDRVAFASGRYSPQSREGRRLLAHELAHTIQQTSPAAAATRTANPGAAIPSRAFKSNRALHAAAPGPTAPSVPCGASRQMQRKIELRDQPNYSGFARVPELLNRLSTISPNLKFTLGHSNALNIESKSGAKLNEIDVTKLNNFEKQMVGYVKSPNLIPLRITNSQGRLGDPQHGYNVQIAFDDYHSGYVDIDDLLASDDLGLQEDIVHFLRERSDVPNYAGRLGSDSLARTTRVSDSEFQAAHEAGIDAEAELMRGFFDDDTIQYNTDSDPKVGPGSRGFINGRGDHIYTIMQFGSGSQSGVQSFHVHVETADGKTLTPDQYKALLKSQKGTGSVPVNPKTANGAQPNLLPGLRISLPGDALEDEADRTAEAVLNSSGQSLPATPSRASAGTHPQSAGASSRQENAPAMQREAAGPAQLDAAPPVVGRVLQSSGRPLDKATRDYFEPRFGCDFSKVQIHTDAQAAESARSVNALAYAVGDRIAFASGRYSPQSGEGRRLLAHELAHTIQQSRAVPAAEEGSARAAVGVVPAITRPVAPGVARQPDPDVDAKRKDFENSVALWQWERAAEILNGFNLDDIRKMLTNLSDLQTASIYQGAIKNGAVGPDSNVANLTHAAFLDLNFRENRDAGHWAEAAKYLNGFSRPDISARLQQGLSREQIQLLHDGAVANPEAGPDSNVALLTAQALEAQSSQAPAHPGANEATDAGGGGGSEIEDAGAPAPSEGLKKKAANAAHRTEQLECVVRSSGCGGHGESGAFGEQEAKSYHESCKKETGYAGEPVIPTDQECKHPPKLPVEGERATCSSEAEPEITKLSGSQKLGKAWESAKPHLASDAVETLEGFFSPENIAQMIGLEVVFAALESTPVGWAADAVAAIFIGQMLFEIVGDLLEFFAAMKASNQCELDQAGDALRKAVSTGETFVIAALLSPKKEGEKGKPYEAPASKETVDVVKKDGTIVRVPKEVAAPLAKEGSVEVKGGQLAESAAGEKGSTSGSGSPPPSQVKSSGSAPRATPEKPVEKARVAAEQHGGSGKSRRGEVEAPSSLREEDALAKKSFKTPDGEEHEIIANKEVIARCSGSPCPAISVVYAKDLAANKDFMARYKQIRDVEATDPESAATDAAALVRDMEISRRNAARMPRVGSEAPTDPDRGTSREEWKAMERKRRSLNALDKAFDEPLEERADDPAVKGGRLEYRDESGNIVSKKVPTKKKSRVDIDAAAGQGDSPVPRRPGETSRQAVARVNKIIGKTISSVPELAKLWEKARARVLAEEPLTESSWRRLYPKARNVFWGLVAGEGPEAEAARTVLADAGLETTPGEARAPMLAKADPTLRKTERRISLDHKEEKAIGENWKKALDADNLQFEFQLPNSERENIQQRHPELRPEKKATENPDVVQEENPPEKVGTP